MEKYIPFEFETLYTHNYFSNLDYYFAEYIEKIYDHLHPLVRISLALVSKALSNGDICVDLKEKSGQMERIADSEDGAVKFPEIDVWLEALNKSPAVSDKTDTPLVLDAEKRLYLAKYFDFQERLAKNIVQRVCAENSFVFDRKAAAEKLQELLPGNEQPILVQRNAALNVLEKNFVIISGGPGTGKTFLLSVIKKLLSKCMGQSGGKPLKILSLASTGKAASRMENGRTIHSVLKPLREKPGFQHDKANPLLADAAIIDEASMVDISLLTRFLEAVPENAKIILTGDMHQLTSVQAGSVFRDICSTRLLTGNIFFLDYNFRSKGKTGIENLAGAVKHNHAERIETILSSNEYPDIVFQDTDRLALPPEILNRYILDGYHSFLNADTAEKAFNCMDDFKILCAHNSGNYGTLQINHVCEKILRTDQFSGIPCKLQKKIIMVNANDYQKAIFNGDTGVIFGGNENSGEETAFFRLEGEGSEVEKDRLKQYRTIELPGHDTAFAITIHKSQGSEYKTVLILLPDRLSAVVTRQLLYTGITRAREKVIIIGSLKMILKAASLSIERRSGISDRLDDLLTHSSRPGRKRRKKNH